MAARQPGRSEHDTPSQRNGKIGKGIKTGMWLQEEDQRLREAVARHGCKWVLVAADVGSRTGDQCFKRWNDALNPELDHSPWTAKEDQWLQESVETWGRNWKTIAAMSEKNRSKLAMKNRYSLLQRRQAVNKRKLSQSRPGTGSISHDGSEDIGMWGNDILSDYDGDGDGALGDRSTSSAAFPITQKKPAQFFDPDLMNWNLNNTLEMQQDFSQLTPTTATKSHLPWSDIGFGNVIARDMPIDENSGYFTPSSTPAEKSGHITPAMSVGDSSEKVVVTAHCSKDKLSLLMEAMMGVVDSVAVGRA